MPEPVYAEERSRIDTALSTLRGYKGLSEKKLMDALSSLSKAVTAAKRAEGGTLNEATAVEVRQVLEPITKDSDVNLECRDHARAILVFISRLVPAEKEGPPGREGERQPGPVVRELDPTRYQLTEKQFGFPGQDPASQFMEHVQRIMVVSPVITGGIKGISEEKPFISSPALSAEVGGTYFGFGIGPVGQKQSVVFAQSLLKAGAGMELSPRERGLLYSSLSGSEQLKAELGKDFDTFISKIKEGDVDGAMALLPKDSTLNSYMGELKEKGFILEKKPKEDSMMLWRWGAGVLFVFEQNEMEAFERLTTRSGSSPLFFSLLGLGVWYTDALLTYTEETKTAKAGKAPVTTTESKKKYVVDEPYKKIAAEMVAAMGVGRTFAIVKVHVDPLEQSLTIQPLTQYTEGGAGPLSLEKVPIVGNLDFRGFKLKHGNTGGEAKKDYFDIELRAGSRLLDLGRMFSIDTEVAWGMLQNGINGSLTLMTSPRDKLQFSITGEVGRDDIQNFYYGARAGAQTPLWKSTAARLDGVLTEFPHAAPGNPRRAAGGTFTLLWYF